MNENIKKLLIGAGVDVDEGVARFMGRDAMYVKFLKKFFEDGVFAETIAAYERGDLDGVFNGVHTLKGTAGNMSLTPIYDLSCEITEEIRNDRSSAAAELIKGQIEQMKQKYEEIRSIVSQID